jgi:hypothetical protein
MKFRFSLVSSDNITLFYEQSKYLSGIHDYFPEANSSGTLYYSTSGRFEVL